MNSNLPLVTLDSNDLNNHNFTINTYDYSSEELLIDVVEANNRDITIDTLIVTGYDNAKLYFKNNEHLVTIGLLIFDGIKGLIDGNVFAKEIRILSEQPHIVISNSFNTSLLVIKQRENQDISAIQRIADAINIIPGCGEFSLHPELSFEKRAATSLKQLKEILPQTTTIGLVTSWFINGTNIDNTTILPGRDTGYSQNIEYWSVGNFNDISAYKISKNTNGQTNYGGTPSDNSLIEYIKIASISGMKVMFYPMLLVDDSLKSWRGHISGSPDKIHSFFDNQYRPFILHYANLVKGNDGIGSFIIGSEFKGLTKLRANDGTYPFVEKLIDLSGEVKKILGKDVIITYAADWSEYHTSDGVNRPLDKLWASQSIDVVGIDAYFPLTDTDKKHVSVADIKRGWLSGEGFEYYYDSKENKHSLNNEGWNQWKNLKYWWENYHWVGDKMTNWLPEMKPIWFTEFGAPSISMAGNQPNIFYNPEMRDGGIPKNSDGAVDNAIQRKIIRGTLEFFENSSFVDKIFLWNWDARGLGWHQLDYYRDGYLQKYGHWLDKKIINPKEYSVNFQGPLKFSNISVNTTGGIEVEKGVSLELCADCKLSFDSRANILISDGANILGGEQTYHSDGNFFQYGVLKSTSKMTVNALNVLISGHISSGKELTIEALEKLTLQTLFTVIQGYGSSKSVVDLVSSLEAEGPITLKANQDILIEGALVKGESIEIKSVSGDVKVVPLKLYEEVTKYAKRYYSFYKAMTFQRSSLQATGNNIMISAANILLSAVTSRSQNNTDIQTIGKTIVDSPSEWSVIEIYSTKKRGGITGFFGAREDTYQHVENQQPVISDLTGKSLTSHSGGDQIWAAKGKFVTAELRAGTPEHEATITFLSTYKYTSVKVITSKTGFDFRFYNGNFEIEISRQEETQESKVEQIPTIIETEESFMGYSSGKWVQLSSRIDSKGKVVIDARDIILTAAPDVKFSYATTSSTGFTIGFSPKSGEYGVQIGSFYRVEEELSRETEFNQPSMVKGKYVEFKGKRYEDYGAIILGNVIKYNIPIVIHGVLKNVAEHYFSKEEAAAGIKIGLKSNIGQIFESLISLTDKQLNTPESIINSGFEINRLYDGILEVLSKKSNHGVSGGIWFYADYSKTSSEGKEYRVVPTIISAKEMLESNSEELRITGALIEAYNAYIKTKYLYVLNSENESFQEVNSNGADVQIPIKGSIPPRLAGLISSANQYQKVIFNTQIHVSNNLHLEVEFTGDIKGLYLNAKNLEASFNELILESVQDISENVERYMSAGIGFDKQELENLAFKLRNEQRDQHVVKQVSAILGREKVSIIVKNALRLNGAMIANAEIDPSSGTYTDHGNLTLMVGSLFIQHIMSYDDGVTFGAAVSTGRMLEGGEFGNPSATFSTRSVIGQGEVKIGENEPIPDGLVRDVNAVNSVKQKSGIDAIEGYIPDFKRRDELLQDISWNPADILSSFGQCVENEIKGLGISLDQTFWDMMDYKDDARPADTTEQDIQDDVDEDEALRNIVEKEIITINKDVEFKKLFAGIVDGEVVSKDLPSLDAEEVVLKQYIDNNPKIVSAKLLDLLITSAHASDGRPITEEQQQNIIREFINDIGGGIIDGEKYVGAGLRNNLPHIMYAVDKSLEAVGIVLLASATGWTLALSDAKSYQDAGDKITGFIKGVEETLNKYSTKEERKVLEYTPVGIVAGKVIKQGLSHIIEGGLLMQFEGVLFTKSSIKLVKDARLDGYTSEAAHKLLDSVHFSEIKTAEIMNEQLSKYYSKPPFIAGGKVGLFQADGIQKFVHVFNREIKANDVKGQFMMLEADINGLTALQIKDKFDLPYLPSHIAEVNLPKGTNVGVGTVRPGNFEGSGKATQFYIVDEASASWFSNFKKLKNESKR